MKKMAGIYSREIRDRAKACYMQGAHFVDIARVISCNPDTVSKWSKEEGWPEDRMKLYAETTALAARETSNPISDKIKLQTQVYEAMLSKGIEALKNTDVKSANEAAQLIDKAIKGIDAIHEDALSSQFIYGVAEVLKSKIQDRDLLQQISEELRKVHIEHNNNTV